MAKGESRGESGESRAKVRRKSKKMAKVAKVGRKWRKYGESGKSMAKVPKFPHNLVTFAIEKKKTPLTIEKKKKKFLEKLKKEIPAFSLQLYKKKRYRGTKGEEWRKRKLANTRKCESTFRHFRQN
jgi:hypothetical protein